MHDRNLKPSPDFKDLRFFLDAFNVHPIKNMTSAGQIMHKALKQPLKDFTHNSWKEVLKKYDKYSLRSWLLEGANLSPDTIDYIGVFYNIEAFMDSGLVEILIDECVHQDPQFQYMRKGMN